MKKILFSIFAIIIISGLTFSGCSNQEPSSTTAAETSVPVKNAPIELNMVMMVPKAHTMNINVQRGFIDRVNEAAKGELVIINRGGPEVINANDLGKAVQSGVVDFAALGTMYEPLVPGMVGMMLSRQSVDEERKSGGAYDYLNELHKKAGLLYLGRGGSSEIDYFYTVTNKKLEKPQDFKGLLIGGTGASQAPVKGWGANYVAVTMGDYFTSVQTKLVDGLATMPITTFVSYGLPPVTKYVIDIPYYKCTVCMIMNLNTYNKLPAHLQKVIMDAEIQMEHDMNTWDLEDRAKARDASTKAGVEFYQLPPDVAKWYVDSAYSAGWDFEIQKNGDISRKLKVLYSSN